MHQNEKKSTMSSFAWAFAERAGTQVASFIVSIVLARLLGPKTLGLLALANIFISIMNAVTNTGFGTALIQKKDADNLDFSSTLYFSMATGVFAYIVLFIAAPFIAKFFNVPKVCPVIRVMSIGFIFSSANVVQRAYVIRKMQFRLFFYSSIFVSVFSAIVGISMAYLGFGVWALVAQQLTKSVVDIIVLAIMSDWRPKLIFSINRIKIIYGFGWKVLVSAVLEAVYQRLRNLVIGKFYDEEALAFYDKGLQFPNLLVTNIDTTIANVLVSAESKVQDTLEKVKNMSRKSVQVSSTLLFPLLLGLMACADNVVPLLLGNKWNPCIPYIKILCIALMMMPVQTANMQGFLAIGKSDVYLRIKLIQKIVGTLVIVLALILSKSPISIAYSELVAYILFAAIMFVPNKKHLDYSAKEQLSDLIPQLLAAILMVAVVLCVPFVLKNRIICLTVQVLSGAAVYIGVSYLFKLPGFMYLFNILKGILHKGEKQ